MKTKIEKLIADYRKKIDGVDVLLKLNQDNNRHARRDNQEGHMAEFRVERVGLESKKAAYQQAIADFDSLMDYL